MGRPKDITVERSSSIEFLNVIGNQTSGLTHQVKRERDEQKSHFFFSGHPGFLLRAHRELGIESEGDRSLFLSDKHLERFQSPCFAGLDFNRDDLIPTSDQIIDFGAGTDDFPLLFQSAVFWVFLFPGLTPRAIMKIAFQGLNDSRV